MSIAGIAADSIISYRGGIVAITGEDTTADDATLSFNLGSLDKIEDSRTIGHFELPSFRQLSLPTKGAGRPNREYKRWRKSDLAGYPVPVLVRTITI